VKNSVVIINTGPAACNYFTFVNNYGCPRANPKRNFEGIRIIVGIVLFACALVQGVASITPAAETFGIRQSSPVATNLPSNTGPLKPVRPDRTGSDPAETFGGGVTPAETFGNGVTPAQSFGGGVTPAQSFGGGVA
jgi:hypothetical protein